MITLEDAVANLLAEDGHIIKPPCGQPAPLAMNGGVFIGCTLGANHDGDQHEVTIRWARG